MYMRKVLTGLVMMAAMGGSAFARDQVQVVGSSTVFPFSTVVAEQFGRSSNFKTPVIESTGSGGGLKLFCSGIGLNHPDITNASRRIKKSEFDNCAKNGIDMTEVVLGFDGIVLANSRKAPAMSLTLKQIYLALAAKVPNPKKECSADSCEIIDNPYTKWSDVDPSLPNVKIEVLGPPPTSGTRDAFQELALEGGAKKFAYIKNMKKKDKKAYRAIARTVREDGAWIDAGENDNLMVQKLAANKNAVGVFGFSFLDQNSDTIQGATVDGLEPSFDNIAEGKYNISRSLYFYIKLAHVNSVPGIKEFAEAFTSENAFGPEGYLVERGLIPLPESERIKMRKAVKSLTKLEMN